MLLIRALNESKVVVLNGNMIGIKPSSTEVVVLKAWGEEGFRETCDVTSI